MKTPKSFASPCGVLHTGMAAIITLYVGMGFFGYMCYGDSVQGSITLNLNHSEIPAKVVQLLLAVAIYVTHALQCYVAVDIVWNEYICRKVQKDSHKVFWEYVVRTLIVAVTCKHRYLLARIVREKNLFF